MLSRQILPVLCVYLKLIGTDPPPPAGVEGEEGMSTGPFVGSGE